MTDQRRLQRPAARGGPHRALAVGLALVGALIAAEFTMIALQTAPRPPLQAAVLRPVLSAESADAPALTWTNARSGPAGGPLDLTAKRAVVAAGCEGGGAIAIDLSPTTSITLDCSSRHLAGPIELPRRLSNAARSIDVEATSGNPRYVVELLASSR